MYEEIRSAISEASAENNKIAMFHYQVLIHARELTGVDSEEFCRAVGVPVSYATEFRKMLGLARLMESQGTRIVSG